MATFTSGFLYTLDQNGNSTNGKVVALIGNSAAGSVESVDDGIANVGETFTVTFTDPGTGATFDGTYTYVGHEAGNAGVIGQNAAGDFFLFSNDGTIPIGSNLNTFEAGPFAVCFFHGTMIACPDGERAIETLQIGDLILTRDGRSRPVKWVGHRYVNLGLHPDPDTVRPIIFRAHSIADNVPARDLRVSPGHAMYIDGSFVHAYRLVNGTSIALDREARKVTWYHVELDSHDILLAEGAPAESFIDVGNRSGFENSDGPVDLHPNMMPPVGNDWMAKACAPFLLDQQAVEPIWRRLMARAEQLGQGSWTPPQTTDDPALVVRANGRDIRPVVSGTGTYAFTVPATCGPVWLVSRATAPAALQPWVSDNRRLGVAVRGMTLRQGDDVRVIPLDHPTLATGWWNVETGAGSGGWRWTRGTALLPAMFGQPSVLTIETGPKTTYELTGQASRAA